jgi:hypothetical protein
VAKYERLGCVAAGSREFKADVGGGLLLPHHRQDQPATCIVQLSAAALIDGDAGIDEFKVVVDEPACTVHQTPAFLAASQGHLQRPFRPDACLVKPK